jgi:hypothetical protein
VKIGNSASETLALLTVAYGQHATKKSGASEWHRWFKKGQDDVQNDPRNGQPKTQKTDANVDRVRTNGDSTVLFGGADKVTGIYLEEKTRTLV